MFFTLEGELLASAPPAPSRNPASAASSTRFPATAAVPESGTVPGPAEVSTTSASVKLPTAVGAKFTVTVTDWPGVSFEPAAGAPLTEKGAAGSVSPLMIRSAPPTLEMVTVPLSTWSTGAPPKLTTGGVR